MLLVCVKLIEDTMDLGQGALWFLTFPSFSPWTLADHSKQEGFGPVLWPGRLCHRQPPKRQGVFVYQQSHAAPVPV